jgi:hypothetical protein
MRPGTSIPPMTSYICSATTRPTRCRAPRAAGGTTVLNLGDGTTIKVQNILHLNAKDFG